MRKWLQFQDRNLLSLALLVVFIWSLFSVPWAQGLIHSGGWKTFREIILAMVQPDLSAEIIQLALLACVKTITYAIAGMSLAIVIGSLLGLLASGVLFSKRTISATLVRQGARSLLGFLRAIHELIWAWLFVSSFGLSPYAAIFAIAIPYGGILGRIFADMLTDVEHEPIAALTATGASRWQLLFYGYLPLARAGIISYTMYRFECAVRSSAVMSFVGLGGLGFQIQLSLDELHYREVWTFVYVLLLLVVLIDGWSSQWRLRLQSKQTPFTALSILAVAAMTTVSWLYIKFVEKASLLELFSMQNIAYAKRFFLRLLGVGEDKPAFLVADSWRVALSLSYDTLMMSVLAIGIATIVMLLTVIPASQNMKGGRLGWLLYGLIRFSYLLSRAVPELIWAMMIVFLFKPGILPGAIALALHNFGILGKLCAEVIEEMDDKPLKHLRSAGANFPQLLFYGVIPSVFPSFLSYILYRFEVIMRTTVIVGFVGAGGLGQQFKLSMSYFHYSDITLLLLCYCLLVWFADFLSEASRKAVAHKK